MPILELYKQDLLQNPRLISDIRKYSVLLEVFQWAAEDGHFEIVDQVLSKEMSPAIKQQMIAADNFRAFRFSAIGGYLKADGYFKIVSRILAEVAPEIKPQMIASKEIIQHSTLDIITRNDLDSLLMNPIDMENNHINNRKHLILLKDSYAFCINKYFATNERKSMDIDDNEITTINIFEKLCLLNAETKSTLSNQARKMACAHEPREMPAPIRARRDSDVNATQLASQASSISK